MDLSDYLPETGATFVRRAEMIKWFEELSVVEKKA